MARLLPASWAPALQSVLRIVAAFLFLPHGTQKLFGVPAAELRAPVDLLSLMGLAGVLETAIRMAYSDFETLAEPVPEMFAADDE